MTKIKMKKEHTIHVRLSEYHFKAIEYLQKEYGLASKSEVMRMAIFNLIKDFPKISEISAKIYEKECME